MSALEDEIKALKADIEGYRSEYAAAPTRDKAVWAGLITATRNNLSRLLDTQNAAISGATGVIDYVFANPTRSVDALYDYLRRQSLIPPKIPPPKQLTNGTMLDQSPLLNRESAQTRFINEAVSRFHCYKKGVGDKETHKLLIAFAAPGTGKSRLAQSLPDTLKKCGDPELQALARNDTLTILISLGGDTKYTEMEEYASSSLGVRALASYFGFDWGVLKSKPFVSKLTLSACLETILKHRRRDFPDGAPETVLFLAVDDVGEVVQGDLTEDRKNEGRSFLKQITNSLGELLITSLPRCFFTSVLTGTTCGVVTDILRGASHPHYVLKLPLLPAADVKATLSNSAIIDLPPEYLETPEFLLLVADIGGVPRVVEWFLAFLDKNAVGKPFKPDLISLARSHIQAQFVMRYKMTSPHT